MGGCFSKPGGAFEAAAATSPVEACVNNEQNNKECAEQPSTKATCWLEALPVEMLDHIMRHLGQECRAHVNQISKRMHHITRKSLYRAVVLYEDRQVVSFLRSNTRTSIEDGLPVASLAGLEDTVDLHIIFGQIRAKRAIAVFAACRACLRVLQIDDTDDLDFGAEMEIRLVQALSPTIRLQYLTISQFHAGAAYLLLANQGASAYLNLSELWEDEDDVVQSEAIPPGYHGLSTMALHTVELSRLSDSPSVPQLHAVVFGSAATLRVLHLVDIIFPENWNTLRGWPIFPLLRRLVLREYDCSQTKALLQSTPHWEYFLARPWYSHLHCHKTSRDSISACEADNLIASLPSSLQELHLSNLYATPYLAEVLKASILRLRQLRKLPYVALSPVHRSDGPVQVIPCQNATGGTGRAHSATSKAGQQTNRGDCTHAVLLEPYGCLLLQAI